MSATATQPRTRRNDTSNLDANGVFRLSRQRNGDGSMLAPLGSGLACLPDVRMLPPEALVEWRVGPAMLATRRDAPVEDLLAAFLTDVFGPERRRTSRRERLRDPRRERLSRRRVARRRRRRRSGWAGSRATTCAV